MSAEEPMAARSPQGFQIQLGSRIDLKTNTQPVVLVKLASTTGTEPDCIEVVLESLRPEPRGGP